MKLICFSERLPKKFKWLNLSLLLPSLMWPLIFYGSIFIFDHPDPDKINEAYILFFAINAYPLYLFIITELNARLYLKHKKIGLILPIIASSLIVFGVVYTVYSIVSTHYESIVEDKNRKKQGWLSYCDTYQIKNNEVFYKDTLISEADAKTIQAVGCFYAKDKDNVYDGKDVIKGSDPNTFEILDWQWEKDGSTCYYQGKPMEDIDAYTFQTLRYNYSKDKNNVYYYDKIVEGADPVTFKVDEMTAIGEDQFGYYKNGKKN